MIAFVFFQVACDSKPPNPLRGIDRIANVGSVGGQAYLIVSYLHERAITVHILTSDLVENFATLNALFLCALF